MCCTAPNDTSVTLYLYYSRRLSSASKIRDWSTTAVNVQEIHDDGAWQHSDDVQCLLYLLRNPCFSSATYDRPTGVTLLTVHYTQLTVSA